jgi:HPt (histidine-containing phosphotransfer) domain-containing protein
LAEQFLDTLADELAALHTALSGERGQATLLAHSLKGTAGVLGATQLSQAAAELEKRCKAGASDAEVQAAWLPVESAAKADAASLQAALVSLLSDQPADSHAALPNAHGNAMTQAVAELKPLLATEDFSVLEKFAELRPVLAELPEALFSPLEKALQDLDMDGAMRACSAIDEWASCLLPT